MTKAQRVERRRKVQIMLRDNVRCQLCGDQDCHLQVHSTVFTRTVGSDVHHETYEITMCDACKLDEERLQSDDVFLIGLFSQTGLSRRRLYALAVSIRRYFHGHLPREEKFQELTNFLERRD